MNINICEINQATSADGDIWAFGNSVLYRLCQEYPRHDKPDVIVAKIWLIGRSYAAAIERRDPTFDGGTPNDSFYEDKVAPALMRSEIDRRMDQLRKFSSVSREALPEILQTHGYLEGIFKSITGKAKRSLASKYLHFHLPNHFYLYDSRAVKAVRGIKFERSSVKLAADVFDEEYMKFSMKVLAVQEQVELQFSKHLSPRELDTLLLNRVS
jgi:hypothetical protein